jgi:hypothetical protein
MSTHHGSKYRDNHISERQATVLALYATKDLVHHRRWALAFLFELQSLMIIPNPYISTRYHNIYIAAIISPYQMHKTTSSCIDVNGRRSAREVTTDGYSMAQLRPGVAMYGRDVER